MFPNYWVMACMYLSLTPKVRHENQLSLIGISDAFYLETFYNRQCRCMIIDFDVCAAFGLHTFYISIKSCVIN